MASPGATIVAAPQTTFDNASMLHNLTHWTWQHLKHSVNVTRYAPSIEDLLLAGPRMLTKLGSIMSYADTVDGFGQRVIPDPTGSDLFLAPGAVAAAGSITSNMGADASIAAAVAADLVDQDPSVMASRFTVEGARGLGSVFSYATSKWALCCVAMAIILNRTHIFAASRRRLRLKWHVRLLLRILPIVLFLYQARQLLQSIQCQTAPDFAEMRWGNSSKSSELMFANPGGYLHTVSSALLLGASDYDSCRAIDMVPAIEQVSAADLHGSLSLLWPLFGTFCLSHFLETISCAVQGRPVAVETGMTLFEHSLAFAEADAAVSNQLGWGLFSGGSITSNSTFYQGMSTPITISRSMIMKRVNTPPEVLLVAFLSAMSHVTSHILGVFNLQSKFRLANTGFWALCFMSSIVLEALSFSLDDPSSMGLFRFPTVCIIGFIPHVMVFAGIFVCGLIYIIALALSAVSPPESENNQRLTFFQRLRHAHENMQANISLSDIRITREMDFYTALLRTGFGVITMASEAVYLNEDRGVNVKQHTWLEEERFKELERFRMQWTGSNLGDFRYDVAGTIGLVPVKDDQLSAASGYARERAAQRIPKSRGGKERARDGVGAMERSSRWVLALEFLMNINRLILRWTSMLMLRILASLGIRRQPNFLVWLSSRPKENKRGGQEANNAGQASSSSRRGSRLLLFNDENADVEAELRRRLRAAPETANLPDSEIETRLYRLWKYGGLWGARDASGEWQPDAEDDDWDTTSMMNSVAGSEAGSDNELDPWEDEDEDSVEGDGQRTPTQRSPSASRQATPALDTPIAMADLARLLNPSSPEERQEAHALAAHLASDRIMTRSRYARQQVAERTRLLTTAHPQRRQRHAQKLTPEEEAELLEQLIISRRTGPRSSSPSQQDSTIAAGGGRNHENTGSWAGSGDPGQEGPQCVVCHSSPRAIIVWPCRCLSLCDECRVTLAMNNFDKCVCCRREVISFSRIYVP